MTHCLKSVILDGKDVLDEDVWFEPGRHYENVRVVMTDRRAQLRVRVSEANGTPTGEYAAVLFPVQPKRWRSPERYIRAAAPLPPPLHWHAGSERNRRRAGQVAALHRIPIR
jgi:hypothetical protein